MFICRLSLKLNFRPVENRFLTKIDYRDYMSSQLNMEQEVASLKTQNDDEKVIKLQAESLRTFLDGVQFSWKFRTRLFLTMNLLEFFVRVYPNPHYEIPFFPKN